MRDGTAQLVGVVGISGTVTSIGQGLENRATYSWRVRAVDDLGAASEFSPENTFVVDAPVDDPEVVVNGDDCTASRSPGSGLLALVLAALAATRRRRTVARRRWFPTLR